MTLADATAVAAPCGAIAAAPRTRQLPPTPLAWAALIGIGG
jgi:hypothetical protein